MNRITFLTIIVLIFLSSQLTFSQKYLNNALKASSELKYLAENQAEDYIEFEAKQMRGKVQIKWSLDENVSSNTFHILRGTTVSNGDIKWDIITSIDNSIKPKRKFTYIDNHVSNEVYYRLMVINAAEDIHYTSIFKVESRNS